MVSLLFSVALSGCLSETLPEAAIGGPQPITPGTRKGQLVENVSRFGPWIHDPSALQFENGYFVVFSTGNRKDYRSGEYIEGLGINCWYRDRKTGTWQPADIIFTGEDKPAWWDELVPNAGGFWAPDVPFKWVMYYSFEAENDSASAIGRAVATGKAPNLKWKDDGVVLLSPACRERNASCPVAIDPSVFGDEQGNLYMAYGSGTSGIWIVELDADTGHLTAKASEGWSDENEAYHHVAYRNIETDYIEAPYVYRHPSNGYFYLFVNWGGCCRGMKSTYNIRVGRSRLPTGPYLDRTGKDMVDEGGSLVIESEGRYIGPGHAAIYRHTDGRFAFTFHYYDGNDQGKARLAARNLTWVDNWPVVAESGFFESCEGK
jgi:arabinan endo-1,5-alpha-L-arabinosidase